MSAQQEPEANETQPPTPTMPEWIRNRISDLVDYVEQIGRDLWLAQAGISVLHALGELADTIEQEPKHYQFDEPDAPGDLTQTRERAAFAKEQLDKGFPALHAQAVISLWGALEDFIHNFLADLLANHPESWQVEAIQKLRIRVGEYHALGHDERCHYVIEVLEHEVGYSLRQGVTRFEALLAYFGISGSVDDDTCKCLFEMQQVRNALVHRRGIADKRLVDACPWLGLRVGEQLLVTPLYFQRYNSACAKYLTTIVRRFRAHLGLPPLDSGTA